MQKSKKGAKEAVKSPKTGASLVYGKRYQYT
jgi:hypothetical protein